MKIFSCAVAALLVMALAPAPAGAQPGWRQPTAVYGHTPAYDNGYHAGFDIGARDARDGRPFDVRRHDVYRDGDRGYDRRYGNRGQYKQVFRTGFDRGYNDGYSRYGRAVPRDRGYGYPGSRRDPDYGRYPNRYPSYPGTRGGYGYSSPAYDRGFSDGYDKGLDDGRDGRQFDVERHKRYRQGDHGYDDEYGSRDRYKVEYRDAFRQGYERGYSDARGGSRGSGRWWPF